MQDPCPDDARRSTHTPSQDSTASTYDHRLNNTKPPQPPHPLQQWCARSTLAGAAAARSCHAQHAAVHPLRSRRALTSDLLLRLQMSFMFAASPSTQDENTTADTAISLSPKTPNECPGTPVIVPCDQWDEEEEETEPAEKDLSSPTWQYAWAEACDEQDGEAAPAAERQLTEAEELTKLRTENQQLTNQLVQFHTVLQEHMELVGNAAAECSPAQRATAAVPAAASTWGSWFRAAQSNEELRDTEKAAAKTAADAIRSAAETAADTAADSALALLGHPELAPSVERLIDTNAAAIEEEALEYVDALIDASAGGPGEPIQPVEATCNTSDDRTMLWAYSGSADELALAEQAGSPTAAASEGWSLREWAMTRPTTALGYVGRGAALAAGVAGLYAAARYGGPPAARALGSIRERLPAAPSLLSGSSSSTTTASGSTSGGSTSSVKVQDLVDARKDMVALLQGIPEVLQACVKHGGESSMEVGHAYS